MLDQICVSLIYSEPPIVIQNRPIVIASQSMWVSTMDSLKDNSPSPSPAISGTICTTLLILGPGWQIIEERGSIVNFQNVTHMFTAILSIEHAMQLYGCSTASAVQSMAIPHSVINRQLSCNVQF